MKIKDNWDFKDGVTGLSFKVIKGKSLDRLHIDIEKGSNPIIHNRDFFFTKEGKFDGTGSCTD